jgi:hypothetical protein
MTDNIIQTRDARILAGRFLESKNKNSTTISIDFDKEIKSCQELSLGNNTIVSSPSQESTTNRDNRGLLTTREESPNELSFEPGSVNNTNNKRPCSSYNCHGYIAIRLPDAAMQHTVPFWAV